MKTQTTAVTNQISLYQRIIVELASKNISVKGNVDNRLITVSSEEMMISSDAKELHLLTNYDAASDSDESLQSNDSFHS